MVGAVVPNGLPVKRDPLSRGVAVLSTLNSGGRDFISRLIGSLNVESSALNVGPSSRRGIKPLPPKRGWGQPPLPQPQRKAAKPQSSPPLRRPHRGRTNPPKP